MTSLGSPTEVLVNYLLVSHGLTPQDVSWVAIGTGASSVAAVERSRVDAAAVVGSAIPMLQRRYPDLVFLLDTRGPERTQEAFGAPAMPNVSLLARDDWLRTHGDDARRLVRAVKRAMRWVRDQAPDEIRARIPESDRMPDAEADLESIRVMQAALNPDGAMPVGSAAVAHKVLAASNAKVRTAQIDLGHTFTNEFTSAR